MFFSLDRQGRVVDSRVVPSSGAAALDEEALALVRRAQPFPACRRNCPARVDLTCRSASISSDEPAAGIRRSSGERVLSVQQVLTVIGKPAHLLSRGAATPDCERSAGQVMNSASRVRKRERRLEHRCPRRLTAVTPRLSHPLVIIAGAAGITLAGTVALWAHYGTAVFYEMIVAGIAACF